MLLGYLDLFSISWGLMASVLYLPVIVSLWFQAALWFTQSFLKCGSALLPCLFQTDFSELSGLRRHMHMCWDLDDLLTYVP